MIIVWTSVEFRCETFAFLSRIKHAMSWPFVCRDFHSTSVQRSLQAPRKHSFLWKISSKCSLVGLSSGCISALFWVSFVYIFISLSGALGLFRGKANYYQPLKAPGSICFNLFLRVTLFFFVWSDVKKARKQRHVFDILPELICQNLFWSFLSWW